MVARASDAVGVIVRANGVVLVPAEAFATGQGRSTLTGMVPNYFSADEASVSITMPTGREVPGRFLSVDQRTSLASIQIAGPIASAFETVGAKTTPKVSAGDKVTVISPFRQPIPATLTGGIAAGVDQVSRKFLPLVEIRLSRPATGLTGAVVLDSKDQFVGILRAQQAPVAGSSLIRETPTDRWFALSPEMVERVAEGLSKPPYMVPHPYIGLQCDNALKIEGAVITSVTLNSPAALAGLRVGDIIVEADGRPVHTSPDFAEIIFAQSVGSRIQLTVIRGGGRIALVLAITAQPAGVLSL